MLGRLAALLVRLYQVTAGRLMTPRCRFHPSCSEYACRALVTNGLLVGGLQAAWRLLRCNPWNLGGVDHVRPIGAGAGGGPLRRMLSARGARAGASRG